MNRKEMDRFGRRGRVGFVRVVRETAHDVDRVRVLWKDAAGRHVESFPNTRAGIAEARAFAEHLSDELLHPAAPTQPAPSSAAITLRHLRDLYLEANTADWRPKTKTGFDERWGKFEAFADRDTTANVVTPALLDAFKAKLLAAGHSVNQIRQYIATAKRVLAFGVERDHILPTKLVTYRVKFGRDAQRQRPQMAEFSDDERNKILAQWSPRDGRMWRAWVATVLFRYCGPRENAALNLEWQDIDLQSGRIHWRAELAKMGVAFSQPMPEPVREALWVAYGWRIARGYCGPFVFFSPTEKRQARNLPWTYSAYVEALHEGERAAGITPVKYRGAHGFRRAIAGDVKAAKGDKAAADWLGDKSVKVVRDSYLLVREEDLQDTAKLVGGADA